MQTLHKNKKRMTKKGIVFTLIAVLMSLLFITLFSYDFSEYTDMQIATVNTRVKTLDSYVRTFESYSEYATRISAYKTLQAITYNRSEQGVFFADKATFDTMFDQCMRCGYTNCTTTLINCSAPLITSDQKYDLTALLQQITNQSAYALNIGTTFTINSIIINQETPFEVIVTVDMDYTIQDSGNTTSTTWNKQQKIIEQKIQIKNLEDPIVAINTNNAYKKLIIPTQICEFNNTCWNFDNALEFYNRQEYRYYKNATSYLQRFYNDTTYSECCGMESFLNADMVGDINASYTDQYYFNANYYCDPAIGQNDSIVAIYGIASTFKLDERTAGRYGLLADSVRVCP